MSLSIHTIQPARDSRKTAKRVGRGLGSGKGKTSSRGVKGQRARSGGSGGLLIKGLRQTLLRIPKKRGFKSAYPKPQTVNVGDLSIVGGARITPSTLKAAELITDARGAVKILGNGEVKAALTIKGCALSATAKQKIEAAGGKVE